jgi:hypothetical protein
LWNDDSWACKAIKAMKNSRVVLRMTVAIKAAFCRPST